MDNVEKNASILYEPHFPEGSADFSYLPWSLPVVNWEDDLINLEEVLHGISRHPVVFIRYGNILYAIKELPHNEAQLEFELLVQLSDAHLPCVEPIGYAFIQRNSNQSSVLFTKFLDTSVPYRQLFLNRMMEQYQNHLLDAVSGLLVQLHLSGFYWGDCSLSNILFRRDAGALQAYLVDAETTEHHLPPLSPILRYHDLEILEENIIGELTDLQMNNGISLDYSLDTVGSYIRVRYQELWEEITRVEEINQNELYRIDERVRAINNLGFSVKDIELKKEENLNILQLRVFVSDRNFHRNQLIELTGLQAEDKQAQQILNEINELRAHLSQLHSTNVSLEAAAQFWKENIFQPVEMRLNDLIIAKSQSDLKLDIVELYCQILEHKWYLSERVQHDVGHQSAVDDFIHQFV